MSYIPQFTGPIEGWAVNYSKFNLWRVAASMEWEDLMQEAYVVFLRCANKYPELDTPQHFMSLFQRAWINTFTDFAHDDSKLRMTAPSIFDADDDNLPEPMGEVTNDGDLAIMIRQAPREVMMVLNLFLNAPTELVEVALAGWQGRDRRCKAGGSKKICQMLGLPQDLDVMKMVEDYFQVH